jgi:hypothetical protein
VQNEATEGHGKAESAQVIESYVSLKKMSDAGRGRERGWVSRLRAPEFVLGLAVEISLKKVHRAHQQMEGQGRLDAVVPSRTL